MHGETLHQSLKEKQRQERANLILETAEAVFMEKGYRDTSMDEIATRVGIAKGTVYLYFTSKQDLVFALIEKEIGLFSQTIDRLASTQLSARAKFEQLLHYAYQEILGRRVQLLLSFSSNVEARKDLFDKGKHLHDYLNALAGQIARLIEEGKARGEFDATIPTPVIISTFFALLSPQTYRHILDSGQVTPEQLTSYVGHIFFQGITTKE